MTTAYTALSSCRAVKTGHVM